MVWTRKDNLRHTKATYLGLGDHSLSELGYDADWEYDGIEGRFSLEMSSWNGGTSLGRVLERLKKNKSQNITQSRLKVKPSFFLITSKGFFN